MKKKLSTRQKRVLNNLCGACGKNEINPGISINSYKFSKCSECLGENRERYQIAKNQGLCTRCEKNIAEANTSLCMSCREKCKKWDMDRYIVSKNNKICVTCDKNPALESCLRCEKCWLKYSARRNTGSIENWQHIKELLIKQNYKCPYTNKELVLGLNASMDHIVPKSRGGANSLDNLQWVDKKVNSIKLDMTHDEFIELCTNIASKFKGNNDEYPNW